MRKTKTFFESRARKGGVARAKKLTPKQRHIIAVNAANIRWARIKNKLG